MVRPEVKVGSGNSPDTPFSFRGECGTLVITGGWNDDFITVNVGCFCGRGGELWLVFALFLDLSDLLALGGRGGNFHTENDITDFGLSEWGHVYTVRKRINRFWLHVWSHWKEFESIERHHGLRIASGPCSHYKKRKSLKTSSFICTALENKIFNLWKIFSLWSRVRVEKCTWGLAYWEIPKTMFDGLFLFCIIINLTCFSFRNQPKSNLWVVPKQISNKLLKWDGDYVWRWLKMKA